MDTWNIPSLDSLSSHFHSKNKLVKPLGILLIAYYLLQIGYLVLVYTIFCANPSLFLIKYPGYFRLYYAYSLIYNNYLVHSVLLYGLIAFIVFPVVLYIIIDRKTGDTFLAAINFCLAEFIGVFSLFITFKRAIDIEKANSILFEDFYLIGNKKILEFLLPGVQFELWSIAIFWTVVLGLAFLVLIVFKKTWKKKVSLTVRIKSACL